MHTYIGMSTLELKVIQLSSYLKRGNNVDCSKSILLHCFVRVHTVYGDSRENRHTVDLPWPAIFGKDYSGIFVCILLHLNYLLVTLLW